MFKNFIDLRLICFCIFSLVYSGNIFTELVNIDNTKLQNLVNEKTLNIDVRRAEEWIEVDVIESS